LGPVVFGRVRQLRRRRRQRPGAQHDRGDFSGTPLLSKLAYDYANAHVGLEFGGKYFTFFIHGGVSRVWARLGLDGGMVANTGSDTTVQVTSDPKVKAFGSSLKMGIILLLL
jgi:hypothetical protein